MGCGPSKGGGAAAARVAPAAASLSSTPAPRVRGPRPPLSLDVEPLPAGELDAAVERDDAVAVTRCLAGAPSAAELASRPGLLHLAAEHNAAEVIAVLVAAGAPLSYCDDDHQTALHAAVANGHFDAADVLTEKLPCAELHVVDKYKMLPLHLACEHGNPDLIALLLNRGARVVTSPASPTRPLSLPADEEEAECGGGGNGGGGGGGRDSSAPAPNGDANGDAAAPMRQPNFGASPVPKRKQLIAMQKSAIGGTAVFIAEQNGHDEAVAMLIKHCKGEAIPMPAVRDRSGALAPGTDV